MCLNVKDRVKPDKVQEVYKVFSFDSKSKELYTPEMFRRLKKCGWFKAKNVLLNKLFKKKTTSIHGGAIHCFTSFEHAKNAYPSDTFYKTLKCLAYPKHFIATGLYGDVCYSKIWIPKEEFERALNEFNNS